MVSGRTVKLKSVNWMTIYYICHDIKQTVKFSCHTVYSHTHTYAHAHNTHTRTIHTHTHTHTHAPGIFDWAEHLIAFIHRTLLRFLWLLRTIWRPYFNRS